MNICICEIADLWTSITFFKEHPVQSQQQNNLHFSKVPPYQYIKNIFRKFSHVWVAIALFYQMIPKHLKILYAWVSRTHICEICQNPGLTGIGICFVCYQQNWESWKGFEIGLMTIYEGIWYALLCEYSDICHRQFMLHWAINYIIERFWLYFLVFHNINYHSINYRTHQKVTKTLNKVINSSMKHKMSMAYVRIYTQQSIFFHKLSSDHKNDNFEAFSRLSSLLIAAKTNTNSCQAWILVNFINVAPAHSSIQYRNFWYHLVEETHSYPHVWTFPENILKYLYGGLLKSVNLLLRRTVYRVAQKECNTYDQ